MDERITAYIDDLKSQLAGLPQEEIDEALDFYEEFLTEAMEEGKDFDDVIKELDAPDKIAGMIWTETSIIKARRSPGIKNFLKALGSAFKGVKTPLSVFLLSIVELMSFCMVAMFFGGAFVCALGAAAVFLGFIYEGIKVPWIFGLEKVGAFGTALLTGALMVLAAIYLYRFGRLFITVSASLIRKILNRPGKPIPEMEKQEIKTSTKKRRFIPAMLITMAAGVILLGISGLPWKYFVITNSMKPEGMIKNITLEYDPAVVKRMSILTTHTIIRVVEGSSDKITLSYEEPEWLEYSVENTNGMLSFYEKSNGMLPLFSVLSLHEGRTQILVSLPKGFSPDSISLESTGGHMFISSAVGNIEAKTFSGNIEYSTGSSTDSYDLQASTINGKLVVKGADVTEKKIGGEVEYYKDTASSEKIELTSTNGSINID